jgi:hypothetical protein
VSLSRFPRLVYRFIQLRYRKFVLSSSRFLLSPKFVSSSLVIGYSAGGKHDGLGAQFQRILAINALGDFWNIPIRHSYVKQIALHPLDGLENYQDYELYLQDFNRLIGSTQSFGQGNNAVMYVDNLKFRHIIEVLLKIFLSRRFIELRITHPYFFIDAHPSLYLCQRNYEIRERLRSFTTEDNEHKISLHHRHGVGNMAIQPGQVAPREISLSAYSVILKSLIRRHPTMQLCIYTDAPEFDLYFRPPVEQKSSWKNLPSFDGDSMRVLGNSLKSIVELFPGSKVIRGGHPLQTLANMSTSSILVLSRSSFGYVAALLSDNAEVYVPEDFWHPLLPGWYAFTANGGD